MRNRWIFSAVVAAMLAVLPAALGQDAKQPGVWLVETFHPELFPNGGAPFTPWAEAKFKAADRETGNTPAN